MTWQTVGLGGQQDSVCLRAGSFWLLTLLPCLPGNGHRCRAMALVCSRRQRGFGPDNRGQPAQGVQASADRGAAGRGLLRARSRMAAA